MRRLRASVQVKPWSILNLLVSFFLCVGVSGALQPARADTVQWPALFPGKDRFIQAIAREQGARTAAREVTGITVPHHLVAIDLIARGFAMAAGNQYRRVIVLSPDHFKRARRPFATTRRDFATALGLVATDGEAVAALLTHCVSVEESALFAGEHGVHAVLPFIAHHFPTAKVLSVALRIDSAPKDWDALVDALQPLVTKDTLIVQSTDFSHYLPYAQAKARDQHTMNVIATGDPSAVARLSQPGNLDSRAAQYVHMRLQQVLLDATPAIVANRNSQGYTSVYQAETTSYVVQIYERPAPRGNRCAPPSQAWPTQAGEQLFFFAGDTFLGRHVAPRLREPQFARRLRDLIHEVTQGMPLIVNLEGVPLANGFAATSKLQLAMDRALTAEWLKFLNVQVVGLANNHALDFGPAMLEAAVMDLTAQGIVVLRHGEIADLGLFRLAAYTDLSNVGPHRRELLTPEIIAQLTREPPQPPLFAFVHWGREFERAPTPRTRALADALGTAGVALIIGSHSHVASRGLELVPERTTLVANSLGNFIFDQPGCERDGGLLEVRFFPEGTYALRWHAIGNPLHTVIRNSSVTGSLRRVRVPEGK